MRVPLKNERFKPVILSLVGRYNWLPGSAKLPAVAPRRKSRSRPAPLLRHLLNTSTRHCVSCYFDITLVTSASRSKPGFVGNRGAASSVSDTNAFGRFRNTLVHQVERAPPVPAMRSSRLSLRDSECYPAGLSRSLKTRNLTPGRRHVLPLCRASLISS